ncbi:MAG: Methyltransferase type 11 [Promethearchaeota archaeon CR_4]|nr:MAG: Methyltransferase type 11 [Candidatus Lokiarchaeota archaeon CR_4]
MGCHQGEFILDLAKRGYLQSCGLDISRYHLDLARISAKQSRLPVIFKEGDPRAIPFPHDKFDVSLIRRNVLGNFEAAQGDLKVLKEVFRVLKPKGKILVEVFSKDIFQATLPQQYWEWKNNNYVISRQQSYSPENERLVTREIITDTQDYVVTDRFFAVKVYTRESVTDLLSRAGFEVLGFHEARPNVICITAISQKTTITAPPITPKQQRVVGIIFGTPQKSDRVKPSPVYDEDSLYANDIMLTSMRELPGYQFIILQNHDTLSLDLTRLKGRIDYVFNLCDEGFNNDVRYELHIPATLDMLKIPYTGATPHCLSVCADKSIMRGIAIEMGIPVAQGVFIHPGETSYDIPFPFPVIIKPATGNSSFAITQRSVAGNYDEFFDAISEVQARIGYNEALLVEEFLPGADLSVGIVGNPPSSYIVLPITQEDYTELSTNLPSICAYEAKWLPDSPYGVVKAVPAQLPATTLEFVREYSAKLFSRLECRDYARIDWRLDGQGVPRMLEINPNCGLTWDGHLYHMARHNGMSYGDMLGAVLHAAEERLGLPPMI